LNEIECVLWCLMLIEFKIGWYYDFFLFVGWWGGGGGGGGGGVRCVLNLPAICFLVLQL